MSFPMQLIVVLLGSLAAATSADPIYTTQAKVGFTCKGMDKKTKLSVGAITFMAKALEESFNQVHQQIDSGDIFLAGTQYHGRKRSEEGEEGESNLRANYGGSNWWYVSSWGCHLCEKGVATLYDPVSGQSEDADIMMWESEFATRLVESKKPVFQGVRSCTIKINAADEDETLFSDAKLVEG